MIEVLLLLEVINQDNKEVFDKHLKKEGFISVPNEPYVYTGESSTTTFATKAYILQVIEKGLLKTNFDSCDLVFLLNETPYPAYSFDKNINEFELSEK